MSDRFAGQERELCQMFSVAVHGPRRNGLFALWLILRVAGDAVAPSQLTERARRRRAEALARRLMSLTLPNGLGAALRETTRRVGLQPMPPVADLFLDLVPEVRRSLGPRAASILMAATDHTDVRKS